MLANGPRRVARPHALMVPRRHRDGWSSATACELAACRTAMAVVAAWYRSLGGGHVMFCANDSAPNLDYLRDVEAAGGTLAGRGTDVPVTRNPRQDVQHAHLHAFYAEHAETKNHESSAAAGSPVIAEGHRAFSAALGSDAMQGGTGQHQARRRRSRCGAALGRQLLLLPAGRGRPLVGDACTGTIPGRGQPAPGPRRWPQGRTRPEPGRGHQPGPAQPGRYSAAPCSTTGHSATAGQFRDLRGPARTERTVADRGSCTPNAPRAVERGPLAGARDAGRSSEPRSIHADKTR